MYTTSIVNFPSTLQLTEHGCIFLYCCCMQKDNVWWVPDSALTFTDDQGQGRPWGKLDIDINSNEALETKLPHRLPEDFLCIWLCRKTRVLRPNRHNGSQSKQKTRGCVVFCDINRKSVPSKAVVTAVWLLNIITKIFRQNMLSKNISGIIKMVPMQKHAWPGGWVQSLRPAWQKEKSNF